MPSPSPTTDMDIIWTAIPAGPAKAAGGLQVVIVPSFKPHDPSGGGTPCPITQLADWPAIVQSIQPHLRISFTDGTGSNPQNVPVQISGEQLNSKLWKAVFADKTTQSVPGSTRHVHTDPVQRPLQTTPLAVVNEGIHALYDQAVSYHTGKGDLSGLFLSHLQVSSQLDPLKWLCFDAYGDPLPEPFDPNPNRLVPNAIKAEYRYADAADLRRDRNIQRVFPALRSTGRAQNLLPFIQTRIAAGANSLIHDFGDAPAKDVAAPAIADYALRWDAFLQHAIFWMRVPQQGLSRRPLSVPDQAKRSAGNAGPLDPTHEPDILERISFVKAYPALAKSIGLAITCSVQFPQNLPPDGMIRVAWDNPPDNTLTGSTPSTCYTYGNGSFFVPFDDTVADSDPDANCYLNGFLDLRSCNLNQSQGKYSLMSLEVDGAALKLIQAAENLCRIEGGRILLTAGGDLQWRNYIAKYEPQFRSVDFAPVRAQGLFSQPLFTDRSWASRDASATHFLGPNQTLYAIRHGKKLVGVEVRLTRNGGGNPIKPRPYTPLDVPLPALRSDGISLVVIDRTQQLNKKYLNFTRAAKSLPDLKGEQLLYGYRPEVSHSSDNVHFDDWKCLTCRKETFSRDGIDLGVPSEERNAILRLTAQQTLDGPPGQPADPSPDLHVSPRLFRWDGKNLGVKGPDPVLPDSSSTPRPVSPLRPWQLIVDTSQPQDTAELLYGHYYKFRVRLVDIAGNDMGPQGPNPTDCSSNAIPYLRYEPVAAPEILLNRRPDTGPDAALKRSLTQMVVTGTYDKDIRWLVPPKAIHTIIKRHGLSTDGHGFTGIQFRADGDFPRVPLHDDGKDPVTRTIANAADDLLPLYLPPSGSSRQKPYFPDPFAEGIAWRLEIPGMDPGQYKGLEGGAGDRASFYAGRSWPSARPWKLVLVTGDDNSSPNVACEPAERTLTVSLPPGTVGRLSLSSYLPKGGEGVMAFTGNLAKSATSVSIQSVAQNGFNPHVTPARVITLMHACVAPQEEPEIDSLYLPAPNDNALQLPHVISRNENTLAASARFGVTLDALSSGKVIVRADWTEPSDTGDAPGRHAGSATLVTEVLPLGLGAKSTAMAPIAATHNLPSPGYRLIAYSAAAVTRFTDQFSAFPATSLERDGGPSRVMMLNCARPDQAVFQYTVPTYKWETSPDGASQFSHTRKGGMRFFLARPWSSTGDDEVAGLVLPRNADSSSDWTTTWGSDPIRSEVFPATTIPTGASFFGYSTFLPYEILDLEGFAGFLVSGKTKARQWASLLGHTIMTLVQNYVEKGGNSEAFRSELAADLDDFIQSEARKNAPQGGRAVIQAAAKMRLALSDAFPEFLAPTHLFESDGSGWKKAQIPELPDDANNPDHLAEIVPFLPSYDSQRGLWYFDITFANLPTEYAFVRLALVRYQPHSVNNRVAVAKPILVDFAQLAPERTVMVWRDPDDSDSLLVQVKAESGIASEAALRLSLWHFYPAAHAGYGEGWKKDYTIPALPSPHGALFYGKIPRSQVQKPTKLVVFELPPEIDPHGGAAVDELDQGLPRGVPYLDILDL